MGVVLVGARVKQGQQLTDRSVPALRRMLSAELPAQVFEAIDKGVQPTQVLSKPSSASKSTGVTIVTRFLIFSGCRAV